MRLFCRQQNSCCIYLINPYRYLYIGCDYRTIDNVVDNTWRILDHIYFTEMRYNERQLNVVVYHQMAAISAMFREHGLLLVIK